MVIKHILVWRILLRPLCLLHLNTVRSAETILAISQRGKLRFPQRGPSFRDAAVLLIRLGWMRAKQNREERGLGEASIGGSEPARSSAFQLSALVCMRSGRARPAAQSRWDNAHEKHLGVCVIDLFAEGFSVGKV